MINVVYLKKSVLLITQGTAITKTNTISCKKEKKSNIALCILNVNSNAVLVVVLFNIWCLAKSDTRLIFNIYRRSAGYLHN